MFKLHLIFKNKFLIFFLISILFFFLQILIPNLAKPSDKILVINKISNSAKIVRVHENIIKSANDNASYRGLELDNGMKCLLISDPKTDRSAASVDVNIGSMLNHVPGLAHFCEHMLFMGSEKFPKENTFNKFIKEHAGFSNAYTNEENTNYHFEISNDKLKDALDIFSQFFIKPLFDADSTSREINAVNSEYNNNLQTDILRIFQLEKSLCKKTHPYSNFGTGNLETLKTIPEANGLNIRDELIKFHEKYYSANLMNVVILSPESLDTMQQYFEEIFTNVPNKNVERVKFELNPFDEKTKGQIYYLVPVQEIHCLILTFELPDYRDYYESNPLRYLSHLIKHEGPGSLLSELKAKGWANSLDLYDEKSARGFQIFSIILYLSEDGVNHVDEIMKLCFQYLNLLRNEGVHKWIVDELIDLGKIEFQYKEKQKSHDYVSGLSRDMHFYKMEHILSGSYYTTKYEPNLIEEILNLLKPEHMKLFVISKKYQGTTDLTEKWYGTEYRQEAIKPELLESLINCGTNPVFKLPLKNEFIPEDLNLVKHESEISKHPYVIKENNLIRLWYKEDDKYLLPKASVRIDIRNPITTQDPKYSNMITLFVNLLTDSLNEYAYAAKLAGLTYVVEETNYGLRISLNGFDNKMDKLLEKILERMVDLKIDEKHYIISKKQHFETQTASDYAAYYMTLLLIENVWTKGDLLNSGEDFTIQDFQEFIPRLLTDGIFIDEIMFGNLSKDRALKISDILESQLSRLGKLRPLLPQQLNNYRQLLLPKKSDFVYVKENKIHKTVGIEIYYQCEFQTTRNNVLTELFFQIISEATFNVLRTQEQLGYIVASGLRRFNGMQGVRFTIQSDRSPDFLNERIEKFVESIKDMLTQMTDDEFQTHVHALELVKLEEPKTISQQCDIYWGEIYSHQYHFERVTVEVEDLKKVTKDDIIEFYDRYISQKSKFRKKLTVFVNPPEMTEEMRNKVKDKLITDLNKFKIGLPLCPFPKAHPYKKITN